MWGLRPLLLAEVTLLGQFSVSHPPQLGTKPKCSLASPGLLARDTVPVGQQLEKLVAGAVF